MKLKSSLRKAVELGIIVTALTSLILVGCGGGSGGTSATTTPPVTTSATITPYKGPFAAGATVKIYDATGSPVALTGSTLNASGIFSVTYTQNVTYPLLAEVTGSYYNEVTGLTETTTVPLRSLITNEAAATNVPVTIVTETAVAILQNSIGGGNFSATNPIGAAAADAALVTAGNNFGVPASAIPVFDGATKKTSDPNTLRLAALAVVADGLGSGTTLADKVKALAQSMASLNAASAPADVVTQAAFDAAITTVTSGASSVAAAGVTPPAAPTIKKFLQRNLEGTWAVHKITAGRTTVVPATGAPSSSTSIWARAAAIYDATGAPSTISFANSTGLSGVVAAPSIPVSADGTITDAANSSVHGTMSAGKDLMVSTGTDFGDPELLIFQKSNVAIAFATADLVGTWDLHGIQSGRTTVNTTTGQPVITTYSWEHSVGTWDTAGLFTPVSTLDSAGNTAVNAPMRCAVAADGTITVPGYATFHGSISAGKDLIVLTNGNGPDPQLYIAQKRNAAVTFSQADLAGTWDAHRIQVGKTTVVPSTGEPFSSTSNWVYRVDTWDVTGVTQTPVSSLDSAGNLVVGGATVSLGAPGSYTLAADGTITVAGNILFHGTMSASKDLFVATQSAGNGDPRLVIFQKRK